MPRRNGRTEISAQVDRVRGDLTAGARDAREIAVEFTDLLIKETELAKAEVSEAMVALRKSAISGAIALVLGILALVFVPLTLMFVFDTFMPLWGAALLTTMLLFVCVAIAGLVAYSMFKRSSPVPKRTIESVQEDLRWLREQMTSSVR
jgi:uncharacterized membrane protein YqjE